ncbi:MAG: hypothetical protein EU547_00245 [Promethearchaeota archaeon]|nr:MAG: hypothetical protein EU547_00245 [Candidatus Lokiarchaeota archaeon]
MDKIKLKDTLFESRLKVNIQDLNEIKQKLSLCEKLGINNVILEPKNEIFKIQSKRKEYIQDLSEVNIYFRNTYYIKDLNELKQKIKLFKKSEDIISIESPNQEVQNYASRDSRIDLISFSNYEILRTASDSVLSLARQYNTFIELCLNSIMIKKKSYQSRVFRSLYKLFNMKIENKLIISGNFKHLYDLRNPRSMISIVHTLFDMPIQKAEDAFSRNVLSLLERVKLRNDPSRFENGVRIIKKEKS